MVGRRLFIKVGGCLGLAASGLALRHTAPPSVPRGGDGPDVRPGGTVEFFARDGSRLAEVPMTATRHRDVAAITLRGSGPIVRDGVAALYVWTWPSGVKTCGDPGDPFSPLLLNTVDLQRGGTATVEARVEYPAGKRPNGLAVSGSLAGKMLDAWAEAHGIA